MNTCRLVRIVAVALIVVFPACGAWAVSVTPEELQQNGQWVQQNLLGGTLPFSFTYNGQSSAGLLPSWAETLQTVQLDTRRTQYTRTWTEPGNRLQVSCTAVQYLDYPVVEWTTNLQNLSLTTLPPVQDLQAVNVSWNRASSDNEFALRGIAGDSCSIDSYKPYQSTLMPNTVAGFAPSGGRSTNYAFPYYNLSVPGGGVTLSVGWPGQWASNFTRDSSTALQVTAGQQNLSVRLNPGETIRTPMAAMCSWKGTDTVRAQNIWRQWMLDYNEPGPNGNPMAPALSGHTNGLYPGMIDTAADEIRDAAAYVNGGARFDTWWLDAGWYPCGGNWAQVGTWRPDPVRFPNGLKEVSDYVHSQGMKFITWFEPERVSAGSELATNYPSWVIGGTNGGLLNLGNPAARSWLTNKIDSLITQQGIDIYRQDFNMDPLSYWQSLDGPNRTGMTENQYVQGYLAYIDELQRRHPDVMMDNCASGGRRNDLESLRRSVPFLRSDYAFNATANQCHTYGLASWIPYAGTQAGVGNDWGRIDNYNVRSAWSPFMLIVFSKTILDGGTADWDAYNRMLDEQRQAAPYMLGDFYPLTPYSQSEDVWMAWQFDRPDLREGMVQAFRRTNSTQSSMTVLLGGLEPALLYELTDLDTKETWRMRGADLMEDGLLLELGQTYSSLVITYEAVFLTSTWAVNADGNWFTSGNWIDGVPSGPGATARFTGATTAAVNADSPVTIGRIVLDAGAAGTNYTIGGSAVTLNNLGMGDGALIDVVSGSHTINSPLILDDDASITGSGTLNLLGGISGDHALEVLGNIAASSIRVKTLRVGSEGAMQTVPEPSAFLLLGTCVLGLLGYHGFFIKVCRCM